jgi:hypothetical protein
MNLSDRAQERMFKVKKYHPKRQQQVITPLRIPVGRITWYLDSDQESFLWLNEIQRWNASYWGQRWACGGGPPTENELGHVWMYSPNANDTSHLALQ